MKRTDAGSYERQTSEATAMRRFFGIFRPCAAIFSAASVITKGDHLSNAGAIALGIGVALVVAIARVLPGVLMDSAPRAGDK